MGDLPESPHGGADGVASCDMYLSLYGNCRHQKFGDLGYGRLCVYTLHLLCETTAQCAGFHKAPQCVQIRVAYIAQRLGLS